jgi:hypothetical protein
LGYKAVITDPYTYTEHTYTIKRMRYETRVGYTGNGTSAEGVSYYGSWDLTANTPEHVKFNSAGEIEYPLSVDCRDVGQDYLTVASAVSTSFLEGTYIDGVNEGDFLREGQYSYIGELGPASPEDPNHAQINAAWSAANPVPPPPEAGTFTEEVQTSFQDAEYILSPYSVTIDGFHMAHGLPDVVFDVPPRKLVHYNADAGIYVLAETDVSTGKLSYLFFDGAAQIGVLETDTTGEAYKEFMNKAGRRFYSLTDLRYGIDAVSAEVEDVNSAIAYTYNKLSNGTLPAIVGTNDGAPTDTAVSFGLINSI